ncbi:hypothetical protein H2201_008639, partial [Coniosporium apollinis]
SKNTVEESVDLAATVVITARYKENDYPPSDMTSVRLLSHEADARASALYQADAQADSLYYYLFEESNCGHKPISLKCIYKQVSI